MMSSHPIKYRRRYEEKVSYISWRFLLLCIGIGFALICLIVRITYLQIINPEELIKKGDMRSLRIKKDTITRGMISDREGRKLAVSIMVYAIWA
ncbi:MAG: peptidoglycan glycosyltransferase FtsI, partial [Arsenophonus sp. ET-DL12-MAG3]